MIIKNILCGLLLSAPRPDVMYDGGIIMKKRRKQGLWLRRNLPLLIAAAALVLLILICVAIYAVLLQNVAISGDAINSIWSIVGYTVLLCFTLFKTGSVARSILGAH